MRYKNLGEPDLKLAGLSLWALSRENGAAQDYWVGNWIHIFASVEASGSYVELSGACLRSEEIAAFAEQLSVLNRVLRGTAKLDTMERMLSATLVCGNRGEIAVTITATPDVATQSHSFEFEIDQSFLAEALAGCSRMIDRFPVKS